MSFNNTLGRIRRCRSASHGWIDLHRLVESFSVLCGKRFDEVFHALEREHGFRRDPGRWPSLPIIQAAAETVAAARAELLRERALLIAEAKARKRAGRRTDPPAELQAYELATQQASGRRPRLGPWGRLGGTGGERMRPITLRELIHCARRSLRSTGEPCDRGDHIG